jgi:hypothetical protein
MTIAVENVSGGAYNGSGATPNSGISGGITTSGTNRLVVIVCVTGRSNTGADFNFPNGITAAGLTFTNAIHQTSTYTDTVGTGGFPVASMSLDVFTAVAATAVSGLAWSTSSMTGDGFVNNGTCFVFALAGSGFNPSSPFDSSGSLPMDAFNASGTASAPALSGFTTSNTLDMLMTIAYNHDAGGPPNTPSASTLWTQIAAPQSDLGTASSHALFVQTQLQTSPATISVTAPYSDNFWFMEGLAFTAGSPFVPHLATFGTVIN